MKSLYVLMALLAMPALAAKNGSEQVLKADAAATSIQWTGKKKVGDKHQGAVKLKNGEIVLAKGEIKSGSISIDLDSITNVDVTDATYNKKLVTHLKSDDFFSVDKFPTADFKIKKVAALKGDKNGNTHTVTGDFTMKGVTNELSFPAKISMTDGKLTAEATISIDRTKWGLKYGSDSFFKNLGDKVIENNFLIDLKLQAKK